MTGWKDISTAPKDGRLFMIGREGMGPEYYEIGYHKPYFVTEYVPVEGEPDLYRKITQQIGEWHGFCDMHRATHWRELPEPPMGRLL